MSQQHSLIGQRLGQYQILDIIGEGGMATVYKAWQAALRRYVAIKVLLRRLREPELIQRFKQEAIVAANLSHPNIVTIYEVGEQEGHLFIAMEYVDGRSLSQVIVEDGPLPMERVLHITQQVAASLDYAHQRQFVHRDIKPANILVTANDYAVITDFGIAKALEGSGATARLTAVGAVVGTPAYMSPEQVQGLPVDYRTDLYSLGIVCYEMLSGQSPFDGTTTAALLYAQVNTPPPSIRQINPSVSRPVDKALTRMLSKKPDDRFPTAGSFVAGLSGIRLADTDRSQLGDQAPALPSWGPTQRGFAPQSLTATGYRRRRSWIPLALAGVALAVLLVSAAFLLGPRLGLLGRPDETSPSPVPVGLSEATALPLEVTTVPIVTPSEAPVPVPTTPDVTPPATSVRLILGPTRVPEDTPSPLPETGETGFPRSLVFYSNRDGDYEIYVLDVDTRDIRKVTDNLVADTNPDWSPDGNLIAFQSDRDGNQEIYVMDSDGGNVRRLTDDPADDLKPMWSPDGQTIAFESDRDGNPELYTVDRDLGAITRLTENSFNDWAPAWSPNGQEIVFISNRDTKGPVYQVYVMKADGSEPRRLTENAFDDRTPCWSPGGQSIAFVSNRSDGNWDVYVMSSGGEALGLARLTVGPGRDWHPMWSPDGGSLAFDSDLEGDTELYLMATSGGDPERLTQDAADDRRPRWKP